MTLAYYSGEVDALLSDFIGNDYFTDHQLYDIIDFITVTIYQYDQSLRKSKLKPLVHFLITTKYQQQYYHIEPPPCTNNEPVTEKLEASDDMAIYEKDVCDSHEEVTNNPDYVNSEMARVNLKDVKCHQDLINHSYDSARRHYKEEYYVNKKNRIVELKSIPQYEQKSVEWLEQRKGCLTATAIAIALNEDPYKYPIELLLDKCGRGKPFEDNINIHHGKKYEHIGTMFYSFRNNITIAEYGMIQHDVHKFIGASPDGICEKYTCDGKLSKLVGRLLEIKFPRLRKIKITGELDGDICPHYYYVQVQTQLYVTGMDECDFLQCQVEEYHTWHDFLEDAHPVAFGLSKSSGLERGCLIQLLPKDLINADNFYQCLYGAKYIYPPKLHMTQVEIEKWVAEVMLTFNKDVLARKYFIDKVIYWRLVKVACHLIKADYQWFESKIPLLRQFWDYVQYYRKHENCLAKLVEFVEDVGIRQSKKIFERVHQDYVKSTTKTVCQPLYQEETSWRIKYKTK